MHKKLENDLMSLAHSLLKMKNKEDVFALKEKAQEIYEKLALLAFVEEYVNTTPNLLATKPEVLQKVEEAIQIKEGTKSIETVAAPTIDKLEKEIEPSKENAEVIDNIEVQQEDLEQEIEQPFDDLENIIFGDTKPINFKDDAKDVGNIPTLEEELKDTIPVDVMANLFEPVKPKSLNDKLQQNINIGLNDRIAFVKHLFDGSQEDFNRVVSQLNTFKTGNEAKNFIHKLVKPDYDWKNQEDLENRFMDIIERKFA